MRPKWVAGAVCLISLSVQAWARSDEAPWLGVWQSKLDGQTGVLVTLADDAGQLGGTVVLNVIRNEYGETRVVGSEPLLLTHARLEERTLTFESVSPRPPGKKMAFSMMLKADGTATIHCTNCNGAPVVDLTKMW